MFSRTSGGRVQMLSSDVQYGRLFGVVCVYTQSHPEVRSLKQIRMTKNAMPQPHSDTQHSPNFLSRDCQAACVSNWSIRMGWCNSGMWRDRAWLWLQTAQHTWTPAVWRSASAQSAILCHVPTSTHSHWALPSAITQSIVSVAPFILFRADWVEWYGAISSWCFIG